MDSVEALKRLHTLHDQALRQNASGDVMGAMVAAQTALVVGQIGVLSALLDVGASIRNLQYAILHPAEAGFRDDD